MPTSLALIEGERATVCTASTPLPGADRGPWAKSARCVPPCAPASSPPHGPAPPRSARRARAPFRPAGVRLRHDDSAWASPSAASTPPEEQSCEASGYPRPARDPHRRSRRLETSRRRRRRDLGGGLHGHPRYYDKRRRRPPPSTPTAGCTRATWPVGGPTSSALRRAVQGHVEDRRRERRPMEVEAYLMGIRHQPRRRWSALPPATDRGRRGGSCAAILGRR